MKQRFALVFLALLFVTFVVSGHSKLQEDYVIEDQKLTPPPSHQPLVNTTPANN